MGCIHAQKIVTNLPVLGGDSLQEVHVECAIKLRSMGDRLKVYQELFALHLEGSMLTSVCPVADVDKWDKCPFRE